MPETKSRTPRHRTVPLQVIPGDYKDFETAIKKFRKVVDKDGVLREHRARQHFTSKRQKRYLAVQRRKWQKRKYGT